MNSLAEELPQLQKPISDVRSAALALSDWTAMARGAFAANTVRAHRAAGVADPTASEEVKLSLKEMARQVPARGLVWKEIEEFLRFEARNLRDVRDRALVAVAYDTMCRREELVSLRVEDIAHADDGSGTVLIARSKTDTSGEGASAYLSPLSMRLLSEWTELAGIKAGPV